jgi:hypothetical protein
MNPELMGFYGHTGTAAVSPRSERGCGVSRSWCAVIYNAKVVKHIADRDAPGTTHPLGNKLECKSTTVHEWRMGVKLVGLDICEAILSVAVVDDVTNLTIRYRNCRGASLDLRANLSSMTLQAFRPLYAWHTLQPMSL